jgi:hypothetical protein
MNLSTTVIQFFICYFVTRWSPSTALHHVDKKIEQEMEQNDRISGEKYTRQLRSISRPLPSRGTGGKGIDMAGQDIAGQVTRGQTNQLSRQQDLDYTMEGRPSSSILLGEPDVYQFNEQEESNHQSSIPVCKRIHLNFEKAANGRTLSGGEFVRGEWFHNVGLNIYAEGHDGRNNLHPMIFDSSHVESNGFGESEGVFALGTPNSDCGGFGAGTGGKEGRSGENCKSLGNLLIPSLKPGSPKYVLNFKGSSYQPPPGGVLIFDFSKKISVGNIGFLNIGGSDEIMVIHNDGSFEKIQLFSLGQNGYQNVPLDLDSVKRLYINLHSFGAVTGLDLCIDAWA